MNATDRQNRLEAIRKALRRGDKRRIAALAGVHPVWVSYVLMGRGVSERVLVLAEQLIEQRAEKPSHGRS